jgi:ectoine hydroxylase-related dioxygenase (phytanoyl-CoA dioxygenase family)
MFRAHHTEATVEPSAVAGFQRDGYAVVEGVLSAAEVEETRAIVTALAHAERASGKAHVYGERVQRVWNLLDKHPRFQELIVAPYILSWMNALFARPTPHQLYFLSSFQSNILEPGAPAQKLHIDTPVPEPLPPWIIKANTIWLLDDFTESNGSTEVIDGSHLRPRKPRPDDPTDEAGIHKVLAPAGSVVFTHGALWHRSGMNRSTRDRIVLLGSFAASYAREIASEEDIVRCLGPDSLARASEQLKTVIGYHHGKKPGGGYA